MVMIIGREGFPERCPRCWPAVPTPWFWERLLNCGNGGSRLSCSWPPIGMIQGRVVPSRRPARRQATLLGGWLRYSLVREGGRG